jgi:Flp pilus assembly protein TadG
MIRRISDLLGTSGAAFVELGMVTPIFATLVIGTVDFGSLFFSSQSVAAATWVGADYARNNPICQQSATGIVMLPVPAIGETCNTNIQTAMQNSRNFSPPLTFPGGNQLVCYCSGDNAACGTNWTTTTGYVCASAGRGNNQVFIRVNASQTAPAPLFPWPGFPTTVPAVTELRLQ